MSSTIRRTTLEVTRSTPLAKYAGDWRDKITMKATVMEGVPCVRNTGITVYEILDKLSRRFTYDDLKVEYNSLKDGDLEAIFACAASGFTKWNEDIEAETAEVKP
jgi:uncharacterized protein (DUF433 family)